MGEIQVRGILNRVRRLIKEDSMDQAHAFKQLLSLNEHLTAGSFARAKKVCRQLRRKARRRATKAALRELIMVLVEEEFDQTSNWRWGGHEKR